MRQGRALGRARRAAGELDVDAVVGIERRLDIMELGAITVVRAGRHVLEAHYAGNGLGSGTDDAMQMREAFGFERTGVRLVEFGR